MQSIFLPENEGKLQSLGTFLLHTLQSYEISFRTLVINYQG